MTAPKTPGTSSPPVGHEEDHFGGPWGARAAWGGPALARDFFAHLLIPSKNRLGASYGR